MKAQAAYAQAEGLQSVTEEEWMAVRAVLAGVMPRSKRAERMEVQERRGIEQRLADAIIQTQYEVMAMLAGRWHDMAETRTAAEAELAEDVELEKVVSAVERGLEQERTGRKRAREEANRRAQREEQEAEQRVQAEQAEEARRSTARGGGASADTRRAAKQRREWGAASCGGTQGKKQRKQRTKDETSGGNSSEDERQDGNTTTDEHPNSTDVEARQVASRSKVILINTELPAVMRNETAHETEKAAGKRRIGERDGSADGGDDVAKRQKDGTSGRTKEIKHGPETAAKRQTSRRPHPWRGDAIDIYTAAMDNGNHTPPHSPLYPPPPQVPRVRRKNPQGVPGTDSQRSKRHKRSGYGRRVPHSTTQV
jgi:hypothetical protein